MNLFLTIRFGAKKAKFLFKSAEVVANGSARTDCFKPCLFEEL